MFTRFAMIAVACWCLLLLVWLPGHFMQLRARSAPTPYPARQLIATALLVLCVVLMFWARRLGFRLALTPQTPALGVVGDALAGAGVGFAIWARIALGRNWSGAIVSVREGQGLVRRGPYAIAATIALWTNMFALVAQSFGKVPALQALAPTQSEPPFFIAELVMLIIFVVLGAAAVRKFHPVAA